MTRTRTIIHLAALIAIPTLTSADEPKRAEYPGYRLVWSDEFDKDGRPDARNWTFEEGFVRNEELQYYRRENARCKDGLLIIEARRERVPNPRYDSRSKSWKRSRKHAQYTSACLTTSGRHAWTYGRFEMRGRIDTRAGMWPAFWTLGTAREWPGCGEIDIMEYYRGMLLANACWGSGKRWKATWDDVRRPIASFKDRDWSKKFHVWRMDWDRDSIRLYVDGELLNTIDVRKTVNPGRRRSNPFREPHYILLNLAIGGTNGGDPKATKLPGRFEIDWVRVYQKRADTDASDGKAKGRRRE